VIEGGWVCRACWRPNGKNEQRCYRCHTPRDQQLTVEPGSLKEQTEPGYELKGRLDADLGILAYLAAWPLRVTGVLEIGFGALLAVAGLVRGDEGLPSVLGMSANIWASLFGVFFVFIGSLKIFLANSVRRHARWAYVVTIAVGALNIALTILGPSAPADGGQTASIGVQIDAWITFGIVLCATTLLVTSYIRREVEGPS
jgi:uncharacterized membrane protein HdeD (DUF308 family)